MMLPKTCAKFLCFGHVIACLFLVACDASAATYGKVTLGVPEQEHLSQQEKRVVGEGVHCDAQNSGFSIGSKPCRFRFSLDYDLASGWHIYWRNPGQAGYPPHVAWPPEITENLISEAWLWGVPERFWTFSLEQAGYTGKGSIPILLDLTRQPKGDSLTAVLSFLVCSAQCIPVDQEVSLSNEHLKQAQTSSAQLPTNILEETPVSSSMTTNWYEEDGELWLDLISEIALQKEAIFITVGKHGYGLQPTRGTFAQEEQNWQKWRFPLVNIDKPEIRQTTSVHVTARGQKQESIITSLSLNAGAEPWLEWRMFLTLPLAFLAGVILNFMPCVFPVLAIKLGKFVSISPQVRAKASAYMLLGFVLAPVSFALLIIVLRQLGTFIGWGGQFQHPWVNLTLALLFTLFALDLLGLNVLSNLWPRLNTLIPGLPARPSIVKPARKRKSQVWSWVSMSYLSFWLATPCGAPILGSVVALSLWSTNTGLMLNFVFVGLGLAFPMILALFLSANKPFLPKSGIWLVRIKQLCALPMVITALWFGSIAWTSTMQFQPPPAWERLDLQNLAKYRASGQTVFVHVTAEWCLTCKVNAWRVFDSGQGFYSLMKQNDVTLMWGDYTHVNEEIRAYLAQHGRYSLPFDILYSTDHPGGTIFSEWLRLEAIEDTLKDSN